MKKEHYTRHEKPCMKVTFDKSLTRYYIMLCLLPSRPIEDREGMCLSVQDELVERDEISVCKEQVQIFEAARGAGVRAVRARGTLKDSRFCQEVTTTTRSGYKIDASTVDVKLTWAFRSSVALGVHRHCARRHNRIVFGSVFG